jgi:hypothetical protein
LKNKKFDKTGSMRRFLKLLNRENGAAGGSGNNMGSNQSQSRKGKFSAIAIFSFAHFIH